MILSHFIDRRIAFETYTLFHIKLETKMNEIMPYYNKIFDSFDDWNLFSDGGNITKNSTDNRQTSKQSSTTSSTQTSSTTSGTNDKRKSDMPQNNIVEIQNGQYLTDYEYDTNSGSDSSTASGTGSNSESGTDSNAYHETTVTDVSNKIEVYEKFIENRNKTMTMIFDDLESLFYGLLN